MVAPTRVVGRARHAGRRHHAADARTHRLAARAAHAHVMADEPDPAPDLDDEIDQRRDAFWLNHEADGERIAFMNGGESTFQATIDEWIREGWKFDWIFGSLFVNNVYMKEEWATNDI
eukprot:5191676-Prymnesium_polylepis.1